MTFHSVRMSTTINLALPLNCKILKATSLEVGFIPHHIGQEKLDLK